MLRHYRGSLNCSGNGCVRSVYGAHTLVGMTSRAATRPVGTVTRGTTNPNRLRRMDRWITAVHGPGLRHTDDPLAIDLGYGAAPGPRSSCCSVCEPSRHARVS